MYADLTFLYFSLGFIAGSLEAAYSLNWGAQRVEGRPWHFYDK